MLAPSRAWPLSQGHGVTVAVVDSGVQADAPQLRGQVDAGKDVTAAGTGDRDCVGHGTFVAGLIAARAQTGSSLVGFAPGVRILPIKVTGTDGSATAATLAAGIRAAADAGARIINVSMVSTLPSDDLAKAVAYAQSRGALIVAAAANDAQLNNPVAYPAAYPGVVGVGAIDVTGALTGFSETGTFVDLVAPGSLVTSVGARGGYYAGSGTSFACPFVSATAALVWSYYPSLTAAQVKARLEATADAPAGATGSTAGYGYGIADPYAAVTAALPLDATPTKSPLRPSSPTWPRPRSRPRRPAATPRGPGDRGRRRRAGDGRFGAADRDPARAGPAVAGLEHVAEGCEHLSSRTITGY
ncbi:type VII secretion-associated serine protease mycosin [Catenulispora yoronensis]